MSLFPHTEVVPIQITHLCVNYRDGFQLMIIIILLFYYFIILLFLSLAKVYGIRVRTFGHKFNFSDRCLIILNHRCHFDWLFFWLVVAMRGDSTKWMVMLKRVAKFAPFFGKSMI